MRHKFIGGYPLPPSSLFLYLRNTMSLIAQAKKIKTGESLSQAIVQAKNAFNTLKSVKTQLNNLKTSMQGDNEFSADDIAEVDSQVLINGVESKAAQEFQR